MARDNPIEDWERRLLKRPVWWRSPWFAVWVIAGLLVSSSLAWSGVALAGKLARDSGQSTLKLRELSILMRSFFLVSEVAFIGAISWAVSASWARDLRGGGVPEIATTPLTADHLLEARGWRWWPILMAVSLALMALGIINELIHTHHVFRGPNPSIETMIRTVGRSLRFGVDVLLGGIVAICLSTRLSLRGWPPAASVAATTLLIAALTLGRVVTERHLFAAGRGSASLLVVSSVCLLSLLILAILCRWDLRKRVQEVYFERH